MNDLCRVRLDEINNDPYDSTDYCAKAIAEHKAMKVLLLTGFMNRLQERLEDQYQEFADFVDNGEPRVMERYLADGYKDKAELIEREADTLASIILG